MEDSVQKNRIRNFIKMPDQDLLMKRENFMIKLRKDNKWKIFQKKRRIRVDSEKDKAEIYKNDCQYLQLELWQSSQEVTDRLVKVITCSSDSQEILSAVRVARNNILVKEDDNEKRSKLAESFLTDNVVRAYITILQDNDNHMLCLHTVWLFANLLYNFKPERDFLTQKDINIIIDFFQKCNEQISKNFRRRDCDEYFDAIDWTCLLLQNMIYESDHFRDLILLSGGFEQCSRALELCISPKKGFSYIISCTDSFLINFDMEAMTENDGAALQSVVESWCRLICDEFESDIKAACVQILTHLCNYDAICKIVSKHSRICEHLIEHMKSLEDWDNLQFKSSVVLCSQLIASDDNRFSNDFLENGILNFIYACKDSEDMKLHIEICMILRNLAASGKGNFEKVILDNDIMEYILNTTEFLDARARLEGIECLQIIVSNSGQYLDFLDDLINSNLIEITEKFINNSQETKEAIYFWLRILYDLLIFNDRKDLNLDNFPIKEIEEDMIHHCSHTISNISKEIVDLYHIIYSPKVTPCKKTAFELSQKPNPFTSKNPFLK